MAPRVSFVMPVYNGEEHFDKALPTVLAQTFEDFEVVVVDDGSTDRTPELLDSVAARDPRVRVLRPGRLGFVRALNHGISEARGEYIARQDFDDASRPERLALQVDFLDHHPDHALVGGAYLLIDDNRGETYVRRPPEEHGDIVRAMARYIPFAHTVVTFRKAAWEDVGGYPEQPDIEDLRMWITFAAAGWKLANLPEIVGDHWVHATSFWHQNFKYQRRQRVLLRLQWRAIRELGLPLWMGVYPLGRSIYGYLPTTLKRFVRRNVAGSRETEVARTS